MPQSGLILFWIETAVFHLKGSHLFKLNHCETFPVCWSNAGLSCAHSVQFTGSVSWRRCGLLRGE